MSREGEAEQQLGPRADLDLTSFPREAIPAGTQVWRSHRAGLGAFWWANSGKGRFDIADRDGDGTRGTMYVGTSLAVAVREATRGAMQKTGWAAEDRVAEFEVAIFTLPQTFSCAAISDARAEGFQVTRELAGMFDPYLANHYAIPQAWAERFADDGFDGINYESRWTNGPGADAWALFRPRKWADPILDGQMTGAEACRAVGIKVLAMPPASAFEESKLGKPR